MKKIHTLNARDNVQLVVIKEYFNLTSEQMHKEIKAMYSLCCNTLKFKGVHYDGLKNCLTPQHKRKEAAFIFDRKCISDNWYGKEVIEKILPLLNKNSSCSVLVGDFINNSEKAKYVLGKVINRKVEYSNQYYIVYINNLTTEMLAAIDRELRYYAAYIKYADMTYYCLLKMYLSTMLCHIFIQHKDIILQSHEDDRDNSENINITGYNFEKYNLKCKSIQDSIYGLFLTYKIERPVFKGFEEDTYFSLNSVDPSPLDISNCCVLVEDEKLIYLKTQKGKIFENAGKILRNANRRPETL